MVDIYDPKPFLHIIAIPGLPGSGFTAPEAAAIRDDVDTLLSRPVITQLNDVPDVNTTAASDGNVLVYDSDTNTWGASPGALPLSVTADGEPMADNVSIVDAGTGLLKSNDVVFGRNRALLSVNFGGTGSSGEVARRDHTHTAPSAARATFNATGYLSTGSRTLATTTVVLAAGVQYLVKATLKPQMRGADSGSAYFTMTTTINGNARTSSGGATSGFWCVQGVPNKESWTHYQTITGTGAAITITGAVAYHSGAGFNVDAGELEIELFPQR